MLPVNAPKNVHHNNHHDGVMNFMHRDEEVSIFAFRICLNGFIACGLIGLLQLQSRILPLFVVPKGHLLFVSLSAQICHCLFAVQKSP